MHAHDVWSAASSLRRAQIRQFARSAVGPNLPCLHPHARVTAELSQEQSELLKTLPGFAPTKCRWTQAHHESTRSMPAESSSKFFKAFPAAIHRFVRRKLERQKAAAGRATPQPTPAPGGVSPRTGVGSSKMSIPPWRSWSDPGVASRGRDASTELPLLLGADFGSCVYREQRLATSEKKPPTESWRHGRIGGFAADLLWIEEEKPQNFS